MKKLIFCLACSVALLAQENPQPAPLKLIDPLGVMKQVQNWQARSMELPRSIKLSRRLDASGVCSVPLLEARADTEIDPRIAASPANHSVAIPQAKVPAPACAKH
jgi:hypothetical protein